MILIETLRAALGRSAVQGGFDVALVEASVRQAGEAKHGDYQANAAMSLAKSAGKPPRAVAQARTQMLGPHRPMAHGSTAPRKWMQEAEEKEGSAVRSCTQDRARLPTGQYLHPEEHFFAIPTEFSSFAHHGCMLAASVGKGVEGFGVAPHT